MNREPEEVKWGRALDQMEENHPFLYNVTGATLLVLFTFIVVISLGAVGYFLALYPKTFITGLALFIIIVFYQFCVKMKQYLNNSDED